MPGNGKPDAIGGVVKGLVVLFSLLLPVAGALYVYFEGEARHRESVADLGEQLRQQLVVVRRELAKTRSDLGLVGRDILHHTEQQDRIVKELHSTLAALRSDLNAHRELGIGGLPHPAGVVAQLRDLEGRLGLLRTSMDDRWRAKDMRAWVKLLEARNPEITVPPADSNGH